MHRVLSCTVISVIGTRGYFPSFSSPRYIGDQGDIFPGSVLLDIKEIKEIFFQVQFSQIYRRSRRYFLRFSQIYRRLRRYSSGSPRYIGDQGDISSGSVILNIGDQGDISSGSPRYTGDQGDISSGSPRHTGELRDIFPGFVILEIQEIQEIFPQVLFLDIQKIQEIFPQVLFPDIQESQEIFSQVSLSQRYRRSRR